MLEKALYKTKADVLLAKTLLSITKIAYSIMQHVKDIRESENFGF